MMSKLSCLHRASCAITVTFLAVLLLNGPTLEPAQAADIHQIESSVQWIPADAAIYCSMLRNREQIDLIAESKAWESIMTMPVVQMGLDMLEQQKTEPGSPLAQYETVMANPQIADAVALLVDMVSDECFLYVEHDAIGPWSLLQETMQKMNSAPYLAGLNQLTNPGEETEDELRAAVVLNTVAENLDDLRIPGVVMGFKLSDPEAAQEQLNNLSGMMALASMMVPQLSGRFNRADIGEYEFLTLKLDGQMIPWETLPLEDVAEFELEEGDAEKVIDKVKESTLVLSLGVRDDYLLMAFDSTTDIVADLGQGDLLVDLSTMQPLAAFADQRLTSISYVSEEFISAGAISPTDVDEIVAAGKDALDATDIDAKLKKQIGQDADFLADEFKNRLSTPGAAMSFCFLTDAGYEAYSHNWTQSARPTEPGPLTLLNHVGADPILAIVGRCNCTVEDYELIAKVCRTAYQYFDQLAPSQMSKSERQQYRQVKKSILPLIQRLHQANRELLVPAIVGGEGALVLDAELKSRRLFKEMPKLEKALPMLEPALVLTINDAQLLRKACAEYDAVMDELVDVIREIEPESVPADYNIPKPKVIVSDEGTIHAYPLPKPWGIERKVAPNAGLSGNIAVLSLVPKQTERLLANAELASPGVLENVDQPRTLACVCNWAGLVDAATPWIDWAVQENTGDDAEMILEQVHTGLNVLKTLRGITSETTIKDGVTITHTLVEVRDIE